MSDQEIDNQEFSANSPGTILMRCREYHRISLDEAAESTKIGKNYLSALENDKISDFASIAYLKGFLRIYAAYLGLNSDDMVKLFERLYEHEGSRSDSQQASSGNNFPGRQPFHWRKLALPAFILILLIITAVFINRSPEPVAQIPVAVVTEVKPPPVQPAISSVSVPLAVPANKNEPVPVSVARKDEVKASDPPKTVVKAQVEAPKAFVVRMKATQSTKLSVTIDGTATQHYDLSSGDIIDWKAENNISLEVSNAGGVEAQLNGKLLNSFGPVGKPAYVVLDAEGVKK